MISAIQHQGPTLLENYSKRNYLRDMKHTRVDTLHDSALYNFTTDTDIRVTEWSRTQDCGNSRKWSQRTTTVCTIQWRNSRARRLTLRPKQLRQFRRLVFTTNCLTDIDSGKIYNSMQ